MFSLNETYKASGTNLPIHSNGGFFAYQVNIDGIDPSWESLDAEFEMEYGRIFVIKYPSQRSVAMIHKC